MLEIVAIILILVLAIPLVVYLSVKLATVAYFQARQLIDEINEKDKRE